MATDKGYIEFVCGQLGSCFPGAEFTYKKMFGEYMVYLNSRPVITVCDNTCFVKINALTDGLLEEKGYPYKGAKEHFVLDVENRELTEAVLLKLV